MAKPTSLSIAELTRQILENWRLRMALFHAPDVRDAESVHRRTLAQSESTIPELRLSLSLGRATENPVSVKAQKRRSKLRVIALDHQP
jgi:hypothetical protein